MHRFLLQHNRPNLSSETCPSAATHPRRHWGKDKHREACSSALAGRQTRASRVSWADRCGAGGLSVETKTEKGKRNPPLVHVPLEILPAVCPVLQTDPRSRQRLQYRVGSAGKCSSNDARDKGLSMTHYQKCLLLSLQPSWPLGKAPALWASQVLLPPPSNALPNPCISKSWEPWPYLKGGADKGCWAQNSPGD